MLGFDVPTFVFQIINFLILLAILTKFLYRPLLNVMQSREDRIAARLQDADERARAADEERAHLQQQKAEASRQAAVLLGSTRADAAHQRQQILEDAREAAASIIEAARRTAEQEAAQALNRMGARLSESAVAVAAEVIRKTAGPQVHEAMVEQLLETGLQPDAGALDGLRLALRHGPHPVQVLTAYPLDEAIQDQLRQALAHTAEVEPESLTLETTVDPALIAGVTIVASTFVIEMSLRDELSRLSSAAFEGRAG